MQINQTFFREQKKKQKQAKIEEECKKWRVWVDFNVKYYRL